MRRRINLAFCSMFSGEDRDVWSGTHYFMLKELRKHFHVYVINPYNNAEEKGFAHYYRDAIFSGFRVNSDVVYYFRKISGILEEKIKKAKPDFLFFPNNCGIVALDLKIPYLVELEETFSVEPWADSLLKGRFKDLRETVLRKLLRKNGDIVFPTNKYIEELRAKGIKPKAKTHCISYGANFEDIPSKQEVQTYVDQRIKKGVCRLLFVGKNWKRKGGVITFETMKELNRRQIPTDLVVCGECPEGIHHPRLKKMGVLNKENPKQLKQLIYEYEAATFLILPTRHEGFGIVFAEAGAWGLPVISTKIESVPYVIEEGKNGVLLGCHQRPNEYADVIERIYNNKKTYKEMSFNAREIYEEKISWERWGEKTCQLICSILEERKRRVSTKN